MRRMKIAVFVEHLPPKMGSDRRIFEIMKRLTFAHEIHFIVFPSVRKLLNKMKNENKSDLHSLEERRIIDQSGITGHFVQIPTIMAMIWQHSIVIAYFFTSIIIFLSTMRILKKVNPNIIVLNYPSPYTGLLGFLEGKFWKKPVVLDFNDLIAQYTANLLNFKKNSFKAKILLLFQHYLAKKSQKVIAPTRFIKKYTVSLGVPKEKIAVIPNGVDTEKFHSNKVNVAPLKFKLNPSGEKLCVYCGRLDNWAGVDIITKLCDIAHTKKLKVKFLLVGDTAEKIFFDKENVILLEETSHERIPTILNNADIILVPFPNNEVSHAASPLKLFEGMAMQKPVIASKVSGIEEVISDEKNGFLASSNDLNEWIKKLEMIINSETLAAKIGQNARQTVQEKYDWNFLAKQYEEVLNTVYLKHQ